MSKAQVLNKKDILDNFNKLELTNEQLIQLQQLLFKFNEKKEIKIEKPKIVINKSSEKYKIALKLVNGILVNIGKSPIDDLTNFKNIDRNDIIKDVNRKLLESMETEIYKYYNKTKCGFYRKKGNKRYIIRVIEVMCEDLGQVMTYKKKGTHVKSISKTNYIYSIN